MNQQLNPLDSIVYITIPAKIIPSLSPEIDPDIQLPVERTRRDREILPHEITVEALIAGMLRVLIYDTANEDADYYRKLVINLRPDIKEEFTEAGIAKARLEDFPVAIEVFQGLCALFPDCGVTHLNSALVHEAAARYYQHDEKLHDHYLEKTFHYYHSALELDDCVPDTYLNFGYFLLEQQNYEKGIELLNIFVSMSSDEEKKAKVQEHLDSLSSYIAMDTLFKEAYDNISMGKEAEGIEKIEKVLEKNRDFWNGWFLLGWGFRRTGKYREAKEAFLKAASLQDPLPDLLNELAISHMELNEYSDSLRCLEQALTQEPENTKVMSNMGIVYLRMGQREKAEAVFKSILEYDPDDPIAKKYLEDM
ncbi:MAG: tetratricopeptide repeat protein [Spirochaetales bacterium]|nr:tetratricopeptide repeat protein [Spirochaetales bacterium]